MAIYLIDKIKPKNNGSFPMVDAEDVLMPDGKRLSEFNPSAGKDGLTPFIGANGNWWIGDEDTGVKAQGEKGETGAQGEQGIQGEKGDKGDKGDPGEGAIIDTTLSQAGQAADAASVGAALDEFNEMAQQLIPQLLPYVTEDDNGKILQVSNGAWSAVELTDVSEVGM